MESELKKITAEQLEKIKEGQLELQEVLTNIGVLESQKHSYLHKLSDINRAIEEFKLEIEKEYGSININLQDGSYTKIAKESGSTPLNED